MRACVRACRSACGQACRRACVPGHEHAHTRYLLKRLQVPWVLRPLLAKMFLFSSLFNSTSHWCSRMNRMKWGLTLPPSLQARLWHRGVCLLASQPSSTFSLVGATSSRPAQVPRTWSVTALSEGVSSQPPEKGVPPPQGMAACQVPKCGKSLTFQPSRRELTNLRSRQQGGGNRSCHFTGGDGQRARRTEGGNLLRN